MNWIKDVAVDIIVTIFIALALWLGEPWMWWIIATYTVLLVIAKGIVLTGEGFLQKIQKSQGAPDWFLHLLYIINIVLLGLATWWYLFAGWCLIWIFSFMGQRKLSKS